MSQFGFSDNTSNAEYAALLASTDTCQLCPEQYLVRSSANVLETVGGEGWEWRLTMNSFPYKNTRGWKDSSTPTKGHLMILPGQHLTNPKSLRDRDDQGICGWERVDELFTLAREIHGANLGGLAMRYYDNSSAWPQGIQRSNGHEAAGLTIAHLHWHILVPELNPETGYTFGHPSTPDAATEHREILFAIG